MARKHKRRLQKLKNIKAEATKAHIIKRAKQRYSKVLTSEEVTNIQKLFKQTLKGAVPYKGKLVKIRKVPFGVEYFFTYEDTVYRVVYDKRFERIVTFLPLEDLR